MTEREYVEHIRKTARAYLDKIEAVDHGIALGTNEEESWNRTKESLSPFTMIELCESWLRHNDDPEEGICGLCGLPGADKIPHTSYWPGERRPETDLVHADCEQAECARAHAALSRIWWSVYR